MKRQNIGSFPKCDLQVKSSTLFFPLATKRNCSLFLQDNEAPSSKQKWRNQKPVAHCFNHLLSPSPSSPSLFWMRMLRVSHLQNSTVSYTEITHRTWIRFSSRRFLIRFAPIAETLGRLSRRPSIITALAFASSFTSSLYREDTPLLCVSAYDFSWLLCSIAENFFIRV